MLRVQSSMFNASRSRFNSPGTELVEVRVQSSIASMRYILSSKTCNVLILHFHIPAFSNLHIFKLSH